MHRVLSALIVVSLAFLMPVVARAENRIALVIGNDNYQKIVKLQKAANDANSIGDALEALGFEVSRAIDANHRDMDRALQNFVRKIEKGDIAMLFYAGHGVEIDGENFLLPVDIPDGKSGETEFVGARSVALDDVLARLRSRNGQLNLVVLDACRNNPFSGTRMATRGLGASAGLARISAPQGTFVMYSADVGEAALDRLGEDDKNPNSVFTRTLIPLMQTPGLDLVDTAREVRRRVRKLARTISHNQTPAYYDAVLGDFYFTAESGPDAEPGGDQGNGSNSLQASLDPEQQGSSVERPNSFVEPVSTAPVGRAMIVTGGEKDSIRLWDAANAKLISELEGEKIVFSAVKITGGGRTLAVASADGALVSYSIPAFKKRNALYPGFTITSIAEAADGTLIAGGSNGMMAAIDPLSFEVRWKTRVHDGIISPIVIQPDQQSAITGSADGTIAVTDLASGDVTARVSTVEGKAITDFDIITPTTVVVVHEDGTIAYLNTRTGKILASFNGGSGWISSVGITPDGSEIVTAGVDGALSFWVLGTSQLDRTVAAHTDVASGAKFMKIDNEKEMISTSFDGKLKLWNKQIASPLAVLDHGSAILYFDYLDGS